ncbi:hypothetical protein Xoosp14_61 [Xanthomonas phage Xoo-sp14]|nr:hypothetical protein Xoosp14_61 [Xanthomonas phage Xoo-sp14]
MSDFENEFEAVEAEAQALVSKQEIFTFSPAEIFANTREAKYSIGDDAWMGIFMGNVNPKPEDKPDAAIPVVIVGVVNFHNSVAYRVGYRGDDGMIRFDNDLIDEEDIYDDPIYLDRPRQTPERGKRPALFIVK